MMPACNQQRQKRLARTGRLFGMVLVPIAAFGLLVGCGTSEEQKKKADGYYGEGMAHLSTDRQRAFVNFQKAVQENPKHRDAHYSLAHLYALQGKLDQAEEELKITISIDPEYSEAHNYLGDVYAMQGHWRKAIPEYRKALMNPLYPTPDVPLYNLGVALAQEGDMVGAAQAFEEALRVSPLSVPATKLHLELGRAYYRLGYDSKAREQLALVTSQDKESREAAAASVLLERLTR